MVRNETEVQREAHGRWKLVAICTGCNHEGEACIDGWCDQLTDELHSPRLGNRLGHRGGPRCFALNNLPLFRHILCTGIWSPRRRHTLHSAEYAAAHALNDVGRRGQRAVYDGQQGWQSG